MLTHSCTEQVVVWRSMSTHVHNEQVKYCSQYLRWPSLGNLWHKCSHTVCFQKLGGFISIFIVSSSGCYCLNLSCCWYPKVQYHQMSRCCINISLNGEGSVKLWEPWVCMQMFLCLCNASPCAGWTFMLWLKLQHKTDLGLLYFPHHSLDLLLFHLSHREELGHQCFDCVSL